MALFGGIFSKDKKEKLDQGLEKSKTSFFSKLSKAVVGKSTVDVEVLDELEEVLITSDVSLDTTIKIIQRIEDRVAEEKYTSVSELDRILREEIAALLAENNTEDLKDFTVPEGVKPYVILVVGVKANI
jgi:fused signal recognition particle receptor